jgi:hypothetical protein
MLAFILALRVIRFSRILVGVVVIQTYLIRLAYFNDQSCSAWSATLSEASANCHSAAAGGVGDGEACLRG